MITAEMMTSHHFQRRWDDDDLWYPLVSTPHALLYLPKPICISYADPSLSLSFFPFLSFNGYTCFTHKPMSITLTSPTPFHNFTCGYPSKHTWYPLHNPLVCKPFLFIPTSCGDVCFPVSLLPVIYYAYEFTLV